MGTIFFMADTLAIFNEHGIGVKILLPTYVFVTVCDSE